MKRAPVIAVLFICAIPVSGQPYKASIPNKTAAQSEAAVAVNLIKWEEDKASPAEADNNAPNWYATLERPDWWLVAIAFLTGLAITYQAREMTRATKEMHDAGRQAAKHLELTERPWICVKLAVAGPLIADDNGVHVTINVILQNVGRSPAVGIWIDPEMYLMSVSKPHPFERRKRMCEEIVERKPDMGHIIFPGEPMIQQMGINALASDIDACIIGDTFYAVELIVVVAYRTRLDESARYYTGVIYDLTRDDPAAPPEKRFGLRRGVSVPLEHLQLGMSVFGGIV